MHELNFSLRTISCKDGDMTQDGLHTLHCQAMLFVSEST